MSEPRTQCVVCGRSILQSTAQSTADERDGRCVPCYSEAIPPPSLEERNQLYREWSSRLRAFAHQCRLELPPPLEDSLSNRERAKQEIYKAILNKPQVGRMTAAICSMPLIAIPIAQRLWAGEDDRMVLLTPAEESRWIEVYTPLEVAFQWFDCFWWNIDDSPKRENPRRPVEGRTIFKWDKSEVHDGESPWVVRVGEDHGTLDAAGRLDLWSWDGSRAKFVVQLSRWIS